MIHRKKHTGHRTSKIVKSTQSYSNGNLPYYCSLLLSARSRCMTFVRSKDMQKQLARTSSSPLTPSLMVTNNYNVPKRTHTHKKNRTVKDFIIALNSVLYSYRRVNVSVNEKCCTSKIPACPEISRVLPNYFCNSIEILLLAGTNYF